MPIEIKELHIKINVDESETTTVPNATVNGKEINSLIKRQIEEMKEKESCQKER